MSECDLCGDNTHMDRMCEDCRRDPLRVTLSRVYEVVGISHYTWKQIKDLKVENGGLRANRDRIRQAVELFKTQELSASSVENLLSTITAECSTEEATVARILEIQNRTK